MPLDVFLSQYFRAHKAVGSKDRRFICDTIYGMVRWSGLLDHLGKQTPSWESRYETFLHFNPSEHIYNKEIPPHVRVSFPKSFFQTLSDSLGENKALEFCSLSNLQAPTTLRANLLKTSREALLKKWKGLYSASAAAYSSTGIVFDQKINFFAMSEFKEGYFEIQDEGSQIIAQLVAAKPGEQVLDFCAGSGGKTLAFAPQMQTKGVIYLHDIRPHALAEAKKRLCRAGVQNAQIIQAQDLPSKNLKRRMDWVLVDAPCSGTGTLRRNPDMKWRFDPEKLPSLVEEQRMIFEEALKYLKPQGHIVYATCSVLPQENEDQIAYFVEQFKLKLVGEPFATFPRKGGMDGFFGAVMAFS